MRLWTRHKEPLLYYCCDERGWSCPTSARNRPEITRSPSTETHHLTASVPRSRTRNLRLLEVSSSGRQPLVVAGRIVGVQSD